MDLSHVALVVLRGSHLLALASLFGTLVSLALVAPAGLRESGTAAPAVRARLVRLAKQSDGLALLIGTGWVVLQAAVMAGATSVSGTLAALGTVLPSTRFGHLVLVRAALLLAAFPLLGGRSWRLAVALALTGAALAMQGGLAHAGAVGAVAGDELLLSEALHLLAAGAWLGGLLPLFMLVGSLPPRAGAISCHSFTPVGMSAVLLIAGTALVQAWQFIGDLGGLFGTEYGRTALLKLGLFFVLLSLAAVNRLVLTDRLRDGSDTVSLRLLRISLAVEIVLGAVVIIIAAFLASDTPATHETPIWPFSRRPSLELLSAPYGRSLLLDASLPSLICVACVLGGWFWWRPGFWLALAVFAVSLPLAISKLASLLTVDAYPTTFAASPTEFADSSIVHGAALFAANCTTCHGVNAQGDGPSAKSLPVLPADLTAPHLWAHTEGDLFWYISHGMDGPSGALMMPAFDRILSSDSRWALIDFLKAHNAGWSLRTTGKWNHPIQLPQFDAICADGSIVNRDDLRGRIVHIIAATESTSQLSATEEPSVATIALSRGRKSKPIHAECVTPEPTTWDAFAILLDVSPDALMGTQALADQNGWLRMYWRPGDPGNWTDSQALAAVIRDIAAHPLPIVRRRWARAPLSRIGRPHLTATTSDFS